MAKASKNNDSNAQEERFQMPENVGDKHPLADEVRNALFHNQDLPAGVNISWGRGEAWLMDNEDVAAMDRAGGFLFTRGSGAVVGGPGAVPLPPADEQDES